MPFVCADYYDVTSPKVLMDGKSRFDMFDLHANIPDFCFNTTILNVCLVHAIVLHIYAEKLAKRHFYYGIIKLSNKNANE